MQNGSYNLKYITIIIKIIMAGTWILIIFGVLLFPDFKRIDSKNSINVLTWSGMYSLSYISKFEKETGIKVRFSYYESNEELLVKLRATKGQGYDLIIPSDYAVYNLKKDKLLKKINKNKLDFLDNLNPILLGHYFDKKNKYSLPAEWAVFGLGINNNYFKNAKNLPQSWALVFDDKLINKYNYKIAISNDPLVAIPVTTLYIYPNLDNLNQEKLSKVQNILKKIRPYIEAYIELKPDYYLVNQSAQIAVASSAHIFRAMQNNKFIDFIVPQEGTLVTIENFAIPKDTHKEDLVYKFINFLMKPESVEYNFKNEQSLLPVTLNAIKHKDLAGTIKKLLTIKKEDFNKFHFLRMDKLKKPITEEYLRELFIKSKL